MKEYGCVSFLSLVGYKLKNIIYSFIIALLVSIAAYKVSSNLLTKSSSTDIKITALGDKNVASTGNVVTFRGATVNGIWYNTGDIITNGDWVEDAKDKTLSWYGEDQESSIVFKLPYGTEQKIVFNVGPDQGKVEVEYGTHRYILDLYSESTISSEKTYKLQVEYPGNLRVIGYIFAVLAFFISFIIFRVLQSKVDYPESDNGREVWGDLLRGFCSFIIVWLHCTCNLFDSFGESITSWYPDLVINSFTAFAVPCFFMLSGAYLLRHEHSIRDMLTKRVPRMFIPLIFWSIIYILINGNPVPSSFIAMFFQNQAPHLWFMYSLFGLYVLLPLLSKVFMSINGQQKTYLLILLLIFPGVLHDIEYLTGFYVNMPHFAVFWPDLGLFFLGGVLWEIRQKISGKRRLFTAGVICGLALTIGVTAFSSIHNGGPDKNFISWVLC